MSTIYCIGVMVCILALPSSIAASGDQEKVLYAKFLAKLLNLPKDIQHHLDSFVPRLLIRRICVLAHASLDGKNHPVITHIGFTPNNSLIFATCQPPDKYFVSLHNKNGDCLNRLIGPMELFNSIGINGHTLVPFTYKNPTYDLSSVWTYTPTYDPRYESRHETGYILRSYSPDRTRKAVAGRFMRNRSTPGDVGTNIGETISLYERKAMSAYDAARLLKCQELREKEQELRRSSCRGRCIIL